MDGVQIRFCGIPPKILKTQKSNAFLHWNVI